MHMKQRCTRGVEHRPPCVSAATMLNNVAANVCRQSLICQAA